MSVDTDALTPHTLRVDALTAPLGLGSPHPEFSWRLSGPDGAVQTAYEIVVDSGGETLWSSGVVGSDAQFGVRYIGAPLRSATAYRWRVRVSDATGTPGPWSAWADFETGLFAPAEWTAAWIGDAAASAHRPVYLHGEIAVPAGVVRARAYATALGWYRLFANGDDLTGAALVPRFTPFDHEVEYQAYDLTDAAGRDGMLRLQVVVADGRFRGALGMHNRRDVYGDQLAARVQVLFELADGGRVWAGTDGSWRAGTGPILDADPKFGETRDLRVAEASAAEAQRAATIVPDAGRRLVAETTPRVRQVGTVAAVSATAQADGSFVVDLGQNLAGVVRLRVAGPAGRRIVLQHAEDIRADGTLEWAHLDREGRKDTTRVQRFQRDEYVLDGTAQTVQPWFTIHGFRYVQVTGLDALDASDVEAVVLSSDAAGTGSFRSSDALLDRLWQNASWSLRSNFTDVPTDCPTRERGGFTGDAMLFAPAATVLSDVQSFFRRYLASLALDQFDDGRVPMIAPGEYSSFSGGPRTQDRQVSGAVGWGDASVLLPWTLYQRYGDTAVLAAQYASAKKWVDHLARGGARKGFIWGEWVRPGESTGAGMMRDNTLNRKNIGLAYLVHSARTLAETAEVLGRDTDARHYAGVAADALAAWRRTAVSRGGRIGVNKQDDYVRALAFDLLPERDRAAAVSRLVSLIEKAGDHLATGFLSTPMLLPTLARFGRADVAYRLLLQTTEPSWLGMVKAGATTITEHWSEPGEKGDREGSSNHYAFGSVVEWLVSGVAGIRSVAPGYRRVVIEPVIGGGLGHAAATVDTPFGAISVSWRTDGDDTAAEVTLPVGVTGELRRRDGTTEELTSGTRTLVL